MARNRRRDPYRNFNFLVPLAAMVGGIAALVILRRLFARAEYRPPGVYIEETPTGTRPIEGVGTSTAGVVGTSTKQAARPSRRAGARRRGPKPRS